MSTRPRAVPVTMGSPRFRTLEVDGLAITEAWFPPGAYLPPHIHDRACFAAILDGSFDVVFRMVTHACPPASVHTEPVAERHANRVGYAGAHVVVLQPDPARAELVGPLTGLLDRITQREHAGIAGLGARLALELDAPDAAASLAAEGLALEMLATAVRIESASRAPAAAPWLLRAQEYIHAHHLEALRVADVARRVGVHPAHLARAFRRHFHASVANYVRRLRLEWAAGELARADAPLSLLALAAGFADQSHFTRAFKRYAGLTPGMYRRAHGHRPPDEASGTVH